MTDELSTEYVTWVRSLKVSKRAVAARDYLLANKTVTTEQLSQMGYDHPPRIIGDLKEAGVAIDKTTVKSSTGKNIAQYFLVEQITEGRLKRTAIPKNFRGSLNAAYGYHCAICSGRFEGRELQADHRIPFLIAGEKPTFEQGDYMPLCASDNRSKSWSCEHCVNWDAKDVAMCESCFWAHPEKYSHIAGRQQRRINLAFQGDEVAVADALQLKAGHLGVPIAALIKEELRTALDVQVPGLFEAE